MEQPQTKEVDELLKKALDLFNENKFSESSDLFSKLLELKSKECKENDPSLAKYYYHYGQSLLYESKSKSDIFGDSVTKTIEERENSDLKDEEEYEEDEEGDEKYEEDEEGDDEGEVEENDAQDNGEVNNDNSFNDNGEIEDDGEQVDNDDAEGDGEVEEDGEDGVVQEGEGQNEKDDALELAWQVLEVARSLADQEPPQDSLLSDIFISLGEIYIENEFPEKALEEFNKALKLRIKINNRRGQAEAHFMLSIAHEISKDSENAIKNLEDAKKILQEENETNNISDIDEMIKEIDEKIETINAIFTAPEIDPFTKEKFDMDTTPDSFTTIGFNTKSNTKDSETTVTLQPRQKRSHQDKDENQSEENLKKQKTS